MLSKLCIVALAIVQAVVTAVDDGVTGAAICGECVTETARQLSDRFFGGLRESASFLIVRSYLIIACPVGTKQA